MDLVFAGTPAFAVPTLEALLAAGHRIVGVYTQPDRPAGRGRRTAPGPVKEVALKRGLPVFQPATLKDGAPQLADLRPQAMIVVAYGLLLPPGILAVPAHGCLNVHASLLPRWRGAAPIQRAIEAGDTVTGVTIMQMERGLDTGPILRQAPLPIEETDTAETLHDKLALLGARLMAQTLVDIERGTVSARAQDDAGATYAAKLTKSEAPLDWTRPADALARKVRALVPWPVAQARQGETMLRVWRARAQAGGSTGHAPGTVVSLDGGIGVATGDGVLLIERLQAEGGKPMEAAAFLNGRALRPGDRLT